MSKPYVYVRGANFPSGRRVVRLHTIVSTPNIPGGVFSNDEHAWVRGRCAELMADPSRWVGLGIDLLNTRATALKVKATTNPLTDIISYPYTAQFLAQYQVAHSVFFYCLDPANRARFAYELRAKPYECELLKANPYTSAVIAGVLAENPGPSGQAAVGGATATVVLIQCAHCRRSYQYTSVSCPWCGAPR